MAVAKIATVQHYMGLSSDTKPTTGVPPGSEFFETDTSLTYIYSGSAWTAKVPFASKTVTFTGAAGVGAVGTVALFTVTGEVLIERIVGYCSTLLGEAAPGGATVSLGVVGSVALFIAATNAVDIDAGEIWVDATPDANGIAAPAALKDIYITDNIQLDVLVAAINSGVLRVDVYWKPLSGGNLVAA